MSNADKRSPSTDALETLGMIHYKPESRDAIHLAVEPVVAGCPLIVGEKIGIIDGVAYPTGLLVMEDGSDLKVPYHGIVDPFLPRGPVGVNPSGSSWHLAWFNPCVTSGNTRTSLLESNLMATIQDYDLITHDARLILGDPVAEAYAWIKAYAGNLSDDDPEYGDTVTVDDLIETGLTHWDEDTIGWGGKYLSRGGLLEGVQTDSTFWFKLRAFSELDIPDDEVVQGSFFSCSC